MRKIDLVVQFSLYWDASGTAAQAEQSVRTTFFLSHSRADFLRWNTSIDSAWATSFFQTYKDEPEINLHWLIEALYEVR